MTCVLTPQLHTPETIHITLPATAVSSAAPIRVDPPLVIAAERRRARFGGHLAEEPEEATIRSDLLSNVRAAQRHPTLPATISHRTPYPHSTQMGPLTLNTPFPMMTWHRMMTRVAPYDDDVAGDDRA